ncbi:MAG: hypothetical protein ACOH2F_00830 [Cellulomonas sp.]
MTPATRTGGRGTYQVQVAGMLGPVLRREFSDLSAIGTPAVTVFRLRLDAGPGLADLAASLQRKGLVLLRARVVRGDSTGRPSSVVPPPPSDRVSQARPGARPDA